MERVLSFFRHQQVWTASETSAVFRNQDSDTTDSETRNMKSKTIIGFWLFIGWDLLIPGWARNISRGFKRLIFCQLPTQSCSFLGVQLQHKNKGSLFSWSICDPISLANRLMNSFKRRDLKYQGLCLQAGTSRGTLCLGQMAEARKGTSKHGARKIRHPK